jgi:nitroreductase
VRPAATLRNFILNAPPVALLRNLKPWVRLVRDLRLAPAQARFSAAQAPGGFTAMSTMPSDPYADTVQLPTPRAHSGTTLEMALKKRHSAREFLPDPLTQEQLSALLWAGFGVNRPGSWGRTAPSACDEQEVVLYAVLPEAAWRYDAREHRLLRVCSGDLRALTGTQEFVASAPLSLVYVIEHDPAQPPPAGTAEELAFLCGVDVGCIVENVYLYCAAAGLATVVRAMVDRPQLATALGLRPHQRVGLAQSIGLPRVAMH